MSGVWCVYKEGRAPVQRVFFSEASKQVKQKNTELSRAGESLEDPLEVCESMMKCHVMCYVSCVCVPVSVCVINRAEYLCLGICSPHSHSPIKIYIHTQTEAKNKARRWKKQTPPSSTTKHKQQVKTHTHIHTHTIITMQRGKEEKEEGNAVGRITRRKKV